MDEISVKLESLEKMIDIIQQDLNTNEQIFLACIALVAALAVPAIIFYVKAVVNQRVENELVKMKENIKNELKLDLNKYNHKRKNFKCMYGTANVFANSQIILCPDMSEREFNTLSWNLELFYTNYPDRMILYSAMFNDGGVTILLKDHDDKYGNFINFKMTWITEEILDN